MRPKEVIVNDDGFPSGPWVGFYNYGPGDRHRMDLHLNFASGCLSGDGNDDVGFFLIRGKYDSTSRECHWTKTYPGSHDVYYRGFQEGKGIWGTWEIGLFARGGFHIWPKGDKETRAAEERAAIPVDCISSEKDTKVPAVPAGGAHKAPQSGALQARRCALQVKGHFVMGGGVRIV